MLVKRIKQTFTFVPLPINENESVACILAINMGRKTKELSLVCKDRIVSLFKQGFSYSKIGLSLIYHLLPSNE
jgi:hypothetical protein